nr:IclR family transcriptional regulator C-terminal domain-containing protein [Arthrobacter sp. Bi83]
MPCAISKPETCAAKSPSPFSPKKENHEHANPAPVFNRRGEVVAGLSIVTLEHRIDAEERELIIESLRASASKICDTLVLSEG